jgi:hypothetical protein
MARKAWIGSFVAASLFAALAAAQDSHQAASGSAATGSSAFFGKSERRYTMNVSLHFLPLIHPSWTNVGGGRIGWIQESDGEKGLELLIGSDPTRAPRKINRWGFIAEHVSGTSASLIGIMSQSDEQSVDQAKAKLDSSEKEHVFKAIRSRSNGGEASSFTVPLPQTEDYTYQDVALLLSKVPKESPAVKKLKIPDGADSGFLFSVGELIDESVDRFCDSRKLNGAKRRQYAYNAALFDLSIVKSKFVKKSNINNKEYADLIESDFEARNRTTGKVSHFSIMYGTRGPISKIPIRITYKPRWWFYAELLLDENAGSVQTARKGGDR